MAAQFSIPPLPPKLLGRDGVSFNFKRRFAKRISAPAHLFSSQSSSRCALVWVWANYLSPAFTFAHLARAAAAILARAAGDIVRLRFTRPLPLAALNFAHLALAAAAILARPEALIRRRFLGPRVATPPEALPKSPKREASSDSSSSIRSLIATALFNCATVRAVNALFVMRGGTYAVFLRRVNYYFHVIDSETALLR